MKFTLLQDMKRRHRRIVSEVADVQLELAREEQEAAAKLTPEPRGRAFWWLLFWACVGIVPIVLWSLLRRFP